MYVSATIIIIIYMATDMIMMYTMAGQLLYDYVPIGPGMII